MNSDQSLARLGLEGELPAAGVGGLVVEVGVGA